MSLPHPQVTDTPVRENFDKLAGSVSSISGSIGATSDSSGLLASVLTGQGALRLPQGPFWGTNSNNAILPGTSNVMYQPFVAEHPLSVDSVAVPIAPFLSTSNSTGALTLDVGIYSRSGSTVSSLTTARLTTSIASGTNATNNWGGFSGFRRFNIPLAISLTPNHYYAALQVLPGGAYNTPVLYGQNIQQIALTGNTSTNPAPAEAHPFGLGSVTRAISANATVAATDLRVATINHPVPALQLYGTAAVPW